jgi:hypothetical protein
MSILTSNYLERIYLNDHYSLYLMSTLPLILNLRLRPKLLTKLERSEFNFDKLDLKRQGVIVGCLLGDGHIRAGNSRYNMTMGIISYDYVQWLINNIFDIFVPSSIGLYPNLVLPQHEVPPYSLPISRSIGVPITS